MLRYLLFLPSITFGLFVAEIFPWALIYASLRLRKLTPNLIGVGMILAFSSAYALIVSEGTSAGETARSLAAYLNPLLAFYVILYSDKLEVQKLTRVALLVFGGFVVLGLLQAAELMGPLDGLFKFLVPRAAAESLGGPRGVTLFSSEPARAALEFLFVYLVFRAKSQWAARHRNLADIFVMLFLALIIKAATGMFLFLVFLALFRPKLLLVTVLALLVAAVSVGQIDTRAFSILFAIINAENFNTAFKFFVSHSGYRFITVYSASLFGVENPFGGGIGLWEISSGASLQASGFDAAEIYSFRTGFVSVRPSSFAANLMLDVGIAGLLGIMLFMSREIKARIDLSNEKLKLLSFFLVSFLFLGDTGDPLPWVCLAILLKSDDPHKTESDLRNNENRISRAYPVSHHG